MAVYTHGLNEVRFNGTKIGMVYKGTMQIGAGTTEKTEHYEEGKQTPAILTKTKNPPTFSFSVMNPDAQFLADYLGGTVTSEGAWKLDNEAVIAPGEFVFDTKNGLDFTIPKGDIDANIAGSLNDTDLLLINFTVTPLAPDSDDRGLLEASVDVNVYA